MVDFTVGKVTLPERLARLLAQLGVDVALGEPVALVVVGHGPVDALAGEGAVPLADELVVRLHLPPHVQLAALPRPAAMNNRHLLLTFNNDRRVSLN